MRSKDENEQNIAFVLVVAWKRPVGCGSVALIVFLFLEPFASGASGSRSCVVWRCRRCSVACTWTCARRVL